MDEETCVNCKNLMLVDEIQPNQAYCKLNSLITVDMVKKCNMFEEKQDTKQKPKAEAKSVANIGKYPRSREGCFKKKEISYPPGHCWEGLTPSQVNEGYKEK